MAGPTPQTGYRSREDLLAENKTLRKDLGLVKEARDLQDKEVERLQERLRMANVSIDDLLERLAVEQGTHQGVRELLVESEKVTIGCPSDHPFKPEGKLQKGHVHQDADGIVTVWCSRGHFDRWFTG